MAPDLIGIPAEDKLFDILADDAIFLSPAAMEWLGVKQGDLLQLARGNPNHHAAGCRRLGASPRGATSRRHGYRRGAMALPAYRPIVAHRTETGAGSRPRARSKRRWRRNCGAWTIPRHRNGGPGGPRRQHVARLPRQPEHAGHGGVVYRRVSGILDAGAIGRSAATQFALLRVLGLTRSQLLGRSCWREASSARSVRCRARAGLCGGRGRAAYFWRRLGKRIFSGVKPSVHFDPLAARSFLFWDWASPCWEAPFPPGKQQPPNPRPH